MSAFPPNVSGVYCPGCQPGDFAQPHICGIAPTMRGASLTPHKCPVCEGRGRVAADFYGPTKNASEQNICQSCHGGGLLWSA